MLNSMNSISQLTSILITNTSRCAHHSQCRPRPRRHKLFVLLCLLIHLFKLPSVMTQDGLPLDCDDKLFDEFSKPFLYTFTVEECNVKCYWLVTSLHSSGNLHKDIFYDQSAMLQHSKPYGTECRDSVHYCENGTCVPTHGELHIMILGAKHKSRDKSSNGIPNAADPYVRVVVGSYENRTNTVYDTYEPTFKSEIFVFQDVSADQSIIMNLKDENQHIPALIDFVKITPAQIIANNLRGIKAFYEFKKQPGYGIWALISFVTKTS